MKIFKIILENPKRFITGAVLIFVVALVALIDNFFLTWLFLGTTFMFAFYEAMKLMKIDENSLFAYALFIWIVAYFYPNPDDLIFIILIIFAGWEAYRQDDNINFIYPFLYVASSYLFILALYKDFGMEALIWLVLIVALADIGAYFTGKLIGKTPFCKTSPNKTWEGVFGGVILATLIGTFYGIKFVNPFLAFVVSLFCAVAAVFGDLFESFLKRRANVKDSGNLFPGHGGMLDRVDGYLFSSVLMVVLLRGLA